MTVTAKRLDRGRGAQLHYPIAPTCAVPSSWHGSRGTNEVPWSAMLLMLLHPAYRNVVNVHFTAILYIDIAV